MAYQLRLGEMIEAMRVAGMTTEAGIYAKTLEAIGCKMATDLAKNVDVLCGEATHGCAMVAAPFHAKHRGQPLPEALATYDDEDEWGTE